MFDITLRVESTKDASKFVNQPSMAVAIVLDVSNTMFTSNLYNPSREAMERFVAKCCADSVGAYTPRELSIITFNTNATVMYPLSDCKNESAGSIINSLDNGMKPITDDIYGYNDSDNRFTNTEAGLRLADYVLSKSKAENKYIIFFTDGLPTTYINRSAADLSSITKIDGYIPISTSGTIGTEGVFYNVPTSQYCYSGTNYSDKGALYAENQADAIKNKNIKIYSVGMNIDSQNPVENMKTFTVDYDGVGDYVVNTSAQQLFDNSVWNYKYKNWLYSEIGSGYYSDGNNLEQITRVYDDIYSKITVDSRTLKATKLAESWKVSDLMNSDSSNKNIEFLSFYDKTGELTNSLSGTSGENTASFDASKDTLNWDLYASGYTIKNVDGEDKYVYELKYRVRLINEKANFSNNTSIPANGETTLKYLSIVNGVVTEKVIDFPTSTVKGYLADLSFIKVDGLSDTVGGTSLSGAQFQLKHSSSCQQCSAIGKRIDIDDKNAGSNASGQVIFQDIPSGHCYDLVETVAPEGYILPSNPYFVEVKEGVVFINGTQVGATLGNEPQKFEINYIITGTDKPASDKTDSTPSTKTDIPYNRNVTLEPGLTTTDDKKGDEPGTWTFSGWYDNEECAGELVSQLNIIKNETVYGKWTFSQRLFTVNFDSNGGSPIASKTDVKWSDKVLNNVSDPTYNKNGYNFIGWTYGNTAVTKDTIYGELADQNTPSVTLKAQWKDTVIEKLPPEIIEGTGQIITAGEAKDLTFRSNAEFSDFIRVEVDGKTIDEKNYTVKEGSTIVTLKADYVATLSSGEHTIGIVSENGTAAITFKVEVKTINNNSPITGDSNHMLLWIALLFVSGITVMKTMIMNKKHSED